MSRVPRAKGADRPVELSHILDAVLKLCRAVDRLERDVGRLAGRIRPVDDEKLPSAKPWIEMFAKREPGVSLKNIWIITDQADKHLKNIEIDVSAIRAYLDQLSNDTYLRSDLKEWVDTDKDRTEER